MLNALTLIVVVLCGVYFVVLGLTCLIASERAKAFFLAFAGSARKHYIEMTLRLIVGASLLVQAPHLEFSLGITVFGWMLIVTTAALLLMPWQWHQRFAQRVLPNFIHYLTLIGIVSILMGSVVLVLMSRRF